MNPEPSSSQGPQGEARANDRAFHGADAFFTANDELARSAEDLLASPDSSWWLRWALASSLDRDIVDALNDVEMLYKTLLQRMPR